MLEVLTIFFLFFVLLNAKIRIIRQTHITLLARPTAIIRVVNHSSKGANGEHYYRFFAQTSTMEMETIHRENKLK